MAGSTPIYGFPYPESSDLVANYPAVGEQLAEDIETVLASGFGKVLQVVRATDTTTRTTTSGTFVDASLSVTITPTKNTSLLILMYSGYLVTPGSFQYAKLQITDSSNNAVSGAQACTFGSPAGQLEVTATLLAYATPASTSALTYKLRWLATGGTATLANPTSTGQLLAIEVAA